MFSIIDIITICVIVVLLIFLFIFLQIENNFSKPRIYLRSAIFLVIFIGIIEELVFLKQYYLVTWAFPLIAGCYLSIYPLIYLYSRDLVLNHKVKSRYRLLKVLALPFAAFVFVSIIYYPMDYNSKILFITLHITESSHGLKEHIAYQYFMVLAYYLQTVFYMIASLKLILIVKRNINVIPWKLLLVKYIMFYVFAVFLYESITILNSILFSDKTIILWTVEQLSSLIFIALGLYIGLKQSLIVFQSRIHKYSEKLLETRVMTPGPAAESEVEAGGFPDIHLLKTNPAEPGKYVKTCLTESEKKEIKEAIENYFNDTKIYLDANLKLELLSKKIHITSRRISIVINEVYGTNFNQFINEYRISEAKKLIALNPVEVKIENIYAKVGFNSRSSFNRAFKESTGISPSDFIKDLISRQSA